METVTLRLKRDRRAQPRIRSRESDGATPEDRDVVVRQETRDGGVVYVLYTGPDARPELLRTRKDSVAQALAFAEGHRMRAWLIAKGGEVVLLGDFRVAT
jgi:hypothetical protein